MRWPPRWPRAPRRDFTRSDAREVLHEVYGFDAFRGEQQEIVDHMIGGGDAVVLMPTGAGKSVCYQVPALVREGTGLVVSPLIALMHDQVDALIANGVRAAYLNSTQTPAERAGVERAYLAGELDLLYVAPERLTLRQARGRTDWSPCSRVVGSASSRSTRPTACRSGGTTSAPITWRSATSPTHFPGVPRLALTATATPATHREITERLRLPEARHFVSSFDRPNIQYRIEPKVDPRRQLVAFIRSQPERSAGIVYALSRKSVEQTADFLRAQGIDALPYHAGLDASRALGQPVAVPARRRRRDGRDDRVRHGDRQARRALRRAHRPAEVRRGLLPGDRSRGPRRRPRDRLDGLRPRRRRPAATAHRPESRRSGVQAAAGPAPRRHARAVRDGLVPPPEPARLLRRGIRPVRQLRHLPRGARHMGRTRPGAEAAVDDRPPAARARPGVRRRSPHRHPARQLDRPHPPAGP